MSDILTVMWKELHELFLQRGARRGMLFSLGIFLVMFGILMPLQLGRDWVDSPASLVYWGFLPFMLVNNITADLFAGERERHTLETLLASRLPSLAILLGKIGTAILYGWVASLVGMLLGLITVNLSAGQGELLLYPAYIAIGQPITSFLVTALAAGIGVLVSLRAATVRQAQQTVGIAFFVVFLPLFLLPMMPAEWQSGLSNFLETANFMVIGISALAIIFVVDVILIGISALRFKRDKLVLD
jgi:ABC-2 type transport system permease protein